MLVKGFRYTSHSQFLVDNHSARLPCQDSEEENVYSIIVPMYNKVPVTMALNNNNIYDKIWSLEMSSFFCLSLNLNCIVLFLSEHLLSNATN